MEASIRTIASAGLLAHGYYQMQNNPSAGFYAPSYVAAALVSLFHFPANRTWRFISGITITAAGLFLLFLSWTFITLEYTPGLQAREAKNMLPVAVGVALITTTRISHDNITKAVHYVRWAILAFLLVVSVTVIATSAKYYHLP